MNPGNSEFTHAFFEASSRGWMANKIQQADCTYAYKCVGTTRGGKPCTKRVTAFETMTCAAHASPKEAVTVPKEPNPKEATAKPKEAAAKPKDAAAKPKEAAAKPTPKTAKPVVSVYMTRAKTHTMAAKR